MLCAVYFATARLGLLMGPVGGFATAVWPPTGISLAALATLGYGLWPGVALGAVQVNLSIGAPPPAAAGMAAGNTLEALLGAYLLLGALVVAPILFTWSDRPRISGSPARVTEAVALGATALSVGLLVFSQGTHGRWSRPMCSSPS
jgi:integral membrane sensor domain MASE1